MEKQLLSSGNDPRLPILLQAGKIRRWGVSNFDVSDMEELVGLPGEADVATNQVLYNLTRRGIEYDLLPWCHQSTIPVMAHSPIEQGRMLGHPELQKVAERHGATAAQVALAWLLRDEEVIAMFLVLAIRTTRTLHSPAAPTAMARTAALSLQCLLA